MPRFSIKDLLVAITFVAAGLVILIQSVDARFNSVAVGLIVFAGGFAMIGAGLLAPFQKKTLGAWLGIGLVVFLFLIATMLVRPH